MKQKNIQKPHIEQTDNPYNKPYSNNFHLVKKNIFGVGVTNAKKEEILEYIINSLKNSNKNYYVTTPNPEMMVYAATHPKFKTILNNAEVALCDGVGLLWGAKVVAKGLKERFTGVELVENLCAKANNQPITVGFFGGKPGVAELAAKCLISRYSKLQIAFIGDTWSEDGFLRARSVNRQRLSVKDNKTIGKDLHSKNVNGLPLTVYPSIDILFVALGFPKQEEWMASHIGKIPVRVMVGVGGALDYLSGKVPRAPKWVQNVGMEWAFRLALQPWRFKRQLALPWFAWMVAREKFYKSS